MEELLIGTTDRTITVFISDPASTDGSGKTGLAAANLTVSYTRIETDNDVVVTDVTSSLSDLTALTDAHSDWGLKEVSNTLAPGLYRLDLADALFATGAWYVDLYVMITTSAAAATPKKFKLVNLDMFGTPATNIATAGTNYSATRGLSGTALPAAAADAAGGLPISDAGGLDLDAKVGALTFTVANKVDANATAISGDATAADNAESFFDGTGYAGTGNVIPTVTTLTNLPAITTNWLTAAGIADGAIDRATFAADTGLQTIRSNTAQAGSISTITLDASASSVDDFYNNMVVFITGGTGAGQAKIIDSYDGTTKVATMVDDGYNVFWTAPDNTSTFAILPQPGFNYTSFVANLPTAFPTLTISGGRVSADMVRISGDSVAADNLEAAYDGTGYAHTGNTYPWTAAWDAEVQSEVTDALEATVADSIPADGTRPSVASACYMICQGLFEGSISGTTWTVKKVDGSTTLFTVTLDNASPTSKTRSG